MEQNYIDELLSLIHSNKSDEELREELQKYHENDVAKIFPQLLSEERQKLYSSYMMLQNAKNIPPSWTNTK
mgnify:CR=1 FL=1